MVQKAKLGWCIWGCFGGHIKQQLKSTHQLHRLLDSSCFEPVCRVFTEAQDGSRFPENSPKPPSRSHIIPLIFKVVLLFTELIKIQLLVAEVVLREGKFIREESGIRLQLMDLIRFEGSNGPSDSGEWDTGAPCHTVTIKVHKSSTYIAAGVKNLYKSRIWGTK